MQVNQALVMTYWQIGKIVKTELLQEGRAPYGAEILRQLAERLTQQFGNGFSYSGLTRMVKFYGYLSEGEMVATLSQPLSWSHFVELIKIEDELKREFYIRVCVEARWSVRTLRGRIDSLCSDKDAEVVELMDLEQDNIHVAEYWLNLPPKEALKPNCTRPCWRLRRGWSFSVMEGTMSEVLNNQLLFFMLVNQIFL